MYTLLVVLSVAFGSIYSQHAEPAPRVNVLWNGCYSECQGKDANNYTLWSEFTEDLVADITKTADWDSQLVQLGPNHQRAVNSLRILARSVLPAGAYTQVEALWLITDGPLQGKYLYEKIIHLALAYLSRFSSVLGYSYVTSKSAVLLIGDDHPQGINAIIGSSFDAFQKQCTTQCRGQGWLVA